MKKRTLILALLVTMVTTAIGQTLTANELTYTIDKNNGSFNSGNDKWNTTYTSNDGNLVLSVGAGNMTGKDSQDKYIELFVGSNKKPYNITAPEGYYVSRYSFDYEKVNPQNEDKSFYIKHNGVNYYPGAGARTFSVNNLTKRIATFEMGGNNNGIYAKNFTVTIKKLGVLPELTEDENAPKYYIIQNVRYQKFAKYRDNQNWLQEDAKLENKSLFYFTGEVLDNGHLKVKIHNKATNNKMADFNSWNEEGIDWYIRMVVDDYGDCPGFAISKADALTDGTYDSWNSQSGGIGPWESNDIGSTFIFTPYEEHKEELPQISTEDNKIFYYIKGLKSNKYATYDGEGNSIKLQSTKDEFSYWYFVENTNIEAPEGHIACYIFNAANAKQVENPASGNYGDHEGNYKTYYIKQYNHDNYIGFAIYPYNEDDAGWNDANGAGTSVGCYNYQDGGSIWYFEPTGHTEKTLLNTVTAKKEDYLTKANNINGEADFYICDEEAINNTVKNINESDYSNLVNTLSSLYNAKTAIAEMKKTPTRPIEPGKLIMLKNKNYNSFLQINGNKLNGNSSANATTNDFATVWVVEAGSEAGKVKLKNYKNGKYIGEIRQSAEVSMTEEANAKEFTFESIDGINIAFHETSGGDYAYGHINGSNQLVGWEKNADASQWIAYEADVPAIGSVFRIESSYQDFKTNQGVTKAAYANGTAPGWKNSNYTDKNFYWTAEAINDNDGNLIGIAIKNVNTETYLTGNSSQSGAWSLSETPDTMLIQVLTNYNCGKLNEININDKHYDMHANGHGTGNGNYSNIVSWNGNNNSASSWYLIPFADVDTGILESRINNVIENKGKIGFPVDSYFDAFTEAINNTEDKDAIENALSTIYNVTDISNLNMPVDGKAYIFKNVQKNGNIYYFKYAESGVTLSHKLTDAEVFVCRKIGDKYIFVNNSGKYFTHKGAGSSSYTGPNSNKGYTDSYDQTPNKFLNDFGITKLHKDNVTKRETDGILVTNELLFGYVGLYTIRHDKAENVYYIMKNNNNGFDQASGPFVREDLTSMIRIEEAEYPNTVNLAAITEDDELVTVNGSSIATFSAPFATVLPENVKAYFATSEEEGVVTIEQIEEGKAIPANQGVILVGQTAGQVVMLPATNEETADGTSNRFGHSAGAAKALAEGEGYILARGNDGIGFYTTSAGTLAMNKAYLNIASNASKTVKIRFSQPGTTAVEDVEIENEREEIYDLTGRKLSEITKPGIYIVGGKKVLVK